LNMHAREARKAEVDQVKVDVLAGWKEAASVYSSREQAALRLTEEVTLIAGGVSDETWEAASADFSEQEMVELLMAISAINVWNRLAVSTHQPLDWLAPVTWRLADGQSRLYFPESSSTEAQSAARGRRPPGTPARAAAKSSSRSFRPTARAPAAGCARASHRARGR